MSFEIANSIFKNMEIKFEFDLKGTIKNIRLENDKISEGDPIYDGHTTLIVDIKVDNVFAMYIHSNGSTYNYFDSEGGTMCSINLRPPIGYSSSESMIK